MLKEQKFKEETLKMAKIYLKEIEDLKRKHFIDLKMVQAMLDEEKRKHNIDLDVLKKTLINCQTALQKKSDES